MSKSMTRMSPVWARVPAVNIKARARLSRTWREDT